MRVYTHWACFPCRKSFQYPPPDEVIATRKCPECQQTLLDMGVYFEPPRRNAKKAWAILKLLSDYDYRFYSTGSKPYIERYIFGTTGRPASMSKRPNLAAIRRCLEQHKLKEEAYTMKRTTKWYREIRQQRRKIRQLEQATSNNSE